MNTPASQLVDDLAKGFSGSEKVSVGDLLSRLDGRGLGLLLIILALPICIPNVPGISTVFGLLLIAPALQMLFGQKSLWMPGFVRAWTFKQSTLQSALKACVSILKRVEFLVRPRILFLSRGLWLSFFGAQTLLMALILLLPMPGANIIPGIAVVLTGLGLLQRDGLSLLLSMPVAAASAAWVYFGARYIVDFTMWVVEKVQALLASLV
ncbi:exopolysaccharide biosynthesis protein [Asticcacaulis excentricus]|uniref:Exopolysaccharide synthesis ExoD n=1 Tax=Asticcacaulis excentricus (strain ATCC 15261 / DSM 4724 / KCTC 12464 / NCIMB 9791 / VKM B-1370 / CB 48) TaxID=573065 RepID=E8RMM5_ASTEC|nr:exopolysaccharide biosynthesis protein [Asticcacaulis excentricus]ADU13906.1 Exopolysaccharide synthesis ExoD [Asticcacaulis excentricus CB 48]